MASEIERKYLLKKFTPVNPELAQYNVYDVYQYYYKVEDHFERIRHTKRIPHGDGNPDSSSEYIHCYKQKIDSDPTEYDERETLMSLSRFLDLKGQCVKGLHKHRYVIKVDSELKWEIDVYQSFNMVIAEFEMPTRDYVVEMPDYIKENLVMEVSDLDAFSNNRLSVPLQLV